MPFDIYGQPLASGACEVHPHINQEYPCSQCLSERNAMLAAYVAIALSAKPAWEREADDAARAEEKNDD